MIAGFMTGFCVMLAAWIFICLIFQQRNEYKASREN